MDFLWTVYIIFRDRAVAFFYKFLGADDYPCTVYFEVKA